MGERICSNCSHCIVAAPSVIMFCNWEENFLPPPVQRHRNWGTKNETWDAAAKDCLHFDHKINQGETS